MEQTNNVERSAMYKEIHAIVKQIPMKSVEHDAMDASSASYLIEQLFKKWQQHNVMGRSELLPDLFRNFIRTHHLSKKWDDFLEANTEGNSP